MSGDWKIVRRESYVHLRAIPRRLMEYAVCELYGYDDRGDRQRLRGAVSVDEERCMRGDETTIERGSARKSPR